MLLISRVWHGPCATYAIYASALASDPKKFVCPSLVLPINYPHCSRTEATTVARAWTYGAAKQGILSLAVWQETCGKDIEGGLNWTVIVGVKVFR